MGKTLHDGIRAFIIHRLRNATSTSFGEIHIGSSSSKIDSSGMTFYAIFAKSQRRKKICWYSRPGCLNYALQLVRFFQVFANQGQSLAITPAVSSTCHILSAEYVTPKLEAVRHLSDQGSSKLAWSRRFVNRDIVRLTCS